MIRASLLCLLLTGTAAFAQPRENQSQAMVVVVDDGGLDTGTVRALRSVAMGAVRRRGVSVSDDSRTEGVHAVNDALGKLAREDLGVQRVFAVRIGGRLGQKILLTAEELSAATLAQVYSASLTAGGLEESDTVMKRLVDAVIDRRPVEDNAGLGSVTAQESKKFNKRPGERFFSLGLPIAFFKGGETGGPFGFSVGYSYEAETFRIGAILEGAARAGQGIGFFGFDADWLPIDGEVSPYLGAGFGYMGANDTGGLGGKAEAGVELFRLHAVRVMAGVELLVPFFSGAYDPQLSSTHNRDFFFLGHVRFAF